MSKRLEEIKQAAERKVNELSTLYQAFVLGAHPATKEQHDLLFQKMKEALCKWDESTKELINNL